jgi:hypothetical protein
MFRKCFLRSDDEAVQPGYGTGLALAAGAAVAAALALTATSPTAKADTIELPDFPIATGASTGQESFGLAPLYDATSYEQPGSYTDLLGDTVNVPSEPLSWDHINLPSGLNSTVNYNGVSDPYPVADGPNGTVLDTTFGEFTTSSGLANIFEDNPYYNPSIDAESDNINDVLAQVGSSNTIEYGVQYLDLPDAATPVDELNFFGAGGDILFSIPVTGDLF